MQSDVSNCKSHLFSMLREEEPIASIEEVTTINIEELK